MQEALKNLENTFQKESYDQTSMRFKNKGRSQFEIVNERIQFKANFESLFELTK